MFWKFWSPLAGSGRQRIDPFYLLKLLLKTRSKSASIEPLTDLLAHLWPKVWAKGRTIIFHFKVFDEKLDFICISSQIACFAFVVLWWFGAIRGHWSPLSI